MITIQQSPSQVSPVYNDIIYILSSNNINQTNFKYVVDIYFAAIHVTRLLVPPHPVHMTGYVNIAPILESQITKEVDTDINDAAGEVCDGHGHLVTVKFGESYGTSGDIFADLITSQVVAWNGVYDYEDYCSYSSGDISCTAASPGRYLTNKPSSGDIMLDDNAWLYFLRPFTNPTQEVDTLVKTYDSNGSLIASRQINSGTVGTSYLFRFPSGININDIPNSNIVVGAVQPILTSSVARYSVTQLDSLGSPVPITEEYWYTVVSDCSIHDKHRIQFLNKLGGYDFFSFTLASKSSSDIERSSFKKGLGSYASANSFVYSPSDRAHTQFYTRIKDKFTITSDWVSEETYAWLEELVTSPDVYLDNGTNLIPINVTNATYESRKTVTNRLFNLTLEYTLSYDRYRQRL